MKKIKSGMLCLMLVSIPMFGTPAIAAGTPDGIPPANEGVCDVLRADGVTRGLYGLCVAFCEAQDHATLSDTITQADLLALQIGAPSGKILQNYNRRKSPEDPDMPCVLVEEDCPCWSAAELAAIDGISDFDGGPTYDFDGGGSTYRAACRPTEEFGGKQIFETVIDSSRTRTTYGSSALVSPQRCHYQSDAPVPTVSRTLSTSDGSLTQAQADRCQAAVIDACLATGL